MFERGGCSAKALERAQSELDGAQVRRREISKGRLLANKTRPSEGCGLGGPGLPVSVAWLNSGPPSTSRSVGLSDGAAGGCWRHLGRPGLHSNCQNYAAGVDHVLDGTGLDVSSLVTQVPSVGD